MYTRWPEEDKQYLLDNAHHMGFLDYVGHFQGKYTKQQIRDKLRRCQVPYQKHQQRNWKPANHDFFAEIDDKEKAYALGFFVADGHIHVGSYPGRTCYRVGFTSGDKGHLFLIRDLLESKHKLYEKRDERAKNKCYDLFIYSKTMVNDIISLGYDARKSYTSIYPNIPESLNNHFVRGVFDGDGCLSRKIVKGKYCYPQLDFNGSRRLVSGINECLPEHTTVRQVKRNMWRISFSCRKAFNILEWMYAKSEGLRLKRKHQRYREALSRTGFFLDIVPSG